MYITLHCVTLHYSTILSIFRHEVIWQKLKELRPKANFVYQCGILEKNSFNIPVAGVALYWDWHLCGNLLLQETNSILSNLYPCYVGILTDTKYILTFKVLFMNYRNN